MGILYTKSIVALFFLGAAVIAVLCMFALMGRSERKLSPAFLRNTHRLFGMVFTVLLAVLSYLCIKYVAAAGDQLSLRAVFHGVLALGLIVVLLMKILIIQYYREFMRFVPTLGMIVFALAFVVFFTSAGFFFLRDGGPAGAGGVVVDAGAAANVGVTGDAGAMAVEGSSQTAGTDAGAGIDRQASAADGKAIFAQRCSGCHHADSDEAMFGPGLKGLLAGDALPGSGRPATISNVRKQLLEPVGMMPSFTMLSAGEMADLLAYIETL